MVKVYISPSSQEDNRGVGNYGTEEVTKFLMSCPGWKNGLVQTHEF